MGDPQLSDILLAKLAGWEVVQQARALVAKQVGTLMAPGLHAWGVKEVPRKLPVLVEFFMSAGDGAVRTLVSGEGGWSADELGALVGRIVYGALRKA